MATQLIMTPVILKAAGNETMGGYAILNQLIGYTLLIDFGFTVALQRFLAQATDRKKSGNQFALLISAGRKALWIINCAIGVAIIVASTKLNYLMKVEGALLWQAKTALILQASWVMLRTPTYLYLPAMSAVQEMATISLVAIPVNIFRMLISLSAVLNGFGLIGLVSAGVCAEFINNLILRKAFLLKYADLINTNTQTAQPKLAKKVFGFGLSYWGVNLSAVLLFGSDNLIVGALFGATGASIYYTTKMLGSLAVSTVSRAIDNIYSGAAFLAQDSDRTPLRLAYLRVLRYVMSATVPASLGVFLFSDWLVRTWVGSENFSGNIMAALLSISVFLQLFAHLHGLLALAVGNVKTWSGISVAAGLLSLVCSYFFGRRFGMQLIPLGNCIGLMLINTFLVRRVVLDLNVCSKEFYNALAGLRVYSFIFILLLISKIYIAYSVISLASLLALYSILCLAATWFVCTTKDEHAKFNLWAKSLMPTRS